MPPRPGRRAAARAAARRCSRPAQPAAERRRRAAACAPMPARPDGAASAAVTWLRRPAPTWSAMSCVDAREGLLERQLAGHHLADAGDQRAVVGVGPAPARGSFGGARRSSAEAATNASSAAWTCGSSVLKSSPPASMHALVGGQEQGALGELLHDLLAREALHHLGDLLGVLGVLDRHQRRRRRPCRSRPRGRRAQPVATQSKASPILVERFAHLPGAGVVEDELAR